MIGFGSDSLDGGSDLIGGGSAGRCESVGGCVMGGAELIYRRSYG